MQGATMKFKTREDAIHFVSCGCVRDPRLRLTIPLVQAEKQGWNYHVDKEHKERIPPKSYGKLTPCPMPRGIYGEDD